MTSGGPAVSTPVGGIRAWIHGLKPPGAKQLRNDALGGLTGTISAVPDSMSDSILAGVNPIHALYASTVGPVTVGVTSSTPLAYATTAAPPALIAATALGSLTGQDRIDGLILIALFTGITILLAVVLGVGKLATYIPHAVLVGFIMGVAALIILGQIPPLLGTKGETGGAVYKAIEAILDVQSIDGASLIVGLATIVIAAGLGRTALAAYGAPAAILVTGILVASVFSDVETVGDQSQIARGFPLPKLPEFSAITLDIVSGGMACAVVIMVYAIGAFGGTPDPDKQPRSISQNFAALGFANVVGSFFRSQPMGAALSQAALIFKSGGRSRWAIIFSGVWMLAFLLFLSGLVEAVPMPALAGLLIYGSYGVLVSNVPDASRISRTSTASIIVLVATFLLTLTLPLQYAVASGVLLSILFFLIHSIANPVMHELVDHGERGLEEREPPPTLTSGKPITLDIDGNLYYAGSRTLADRLPAPEGTTGAVAIIDLRGHTTVGATFTDTIDEYAGRIAAADGRLYLTELGEPVYAQLERALSERIAAGVVLLRLATSFRGESSRLAAEEGIADLAK